MRRHQQTSENCEEKSAEILVGEDQTFSIYPNQRSCSLIFPRPEDVMRLSNLSQHLLKPGETTGGGY